MGFALLLHQTQWLWDGDEGWREGELCVGHGDANVKVDHMMVMERDKERREPQERRQCVLCTEYLA
jgi:hypothetical protein